MKVGKPKSKRTPVRLRHKIEKASAAKQRKQRKDAKKNPQWRSRLKKDPGIPNLFPYKDKVLAEIEESKRKKEEEQQRRRDLARAQRDGKTARGTEPVVVLEDKDDELVDAGDNDEPIEDGEEMEEDKNPMAALLASAQARARTYQPAEDEGDDEEEDEDEDDFNGFDDAKMKSSAAVESNKRTLPKQALADPIRAATALIERLQKTQEGIEQLLNYYQLPPLVTAGSDTTTRFLVDVARKRGRLGRGGIPNLNAAALTVLGDLNDERLKLPALDQIPQSSHLRKGEVQIVSQMSQPFRIEGLFGPPVAGANSGDIEVEAHV